MRHVWILGEIAMQLLVGTSGFSYKEWKGRFYPEKFPADQTSRGADESAGVHRFRILTLRNDSRAESNDW